MKKLLTLIVLFICACVFGGCKQIEADEYKYKLEVVDNWNLLVHSLEEEYEAGTTIEVHLAFRSGPSVGIKLNDELIYAKDYSSTCEQLCSVVSFTMPEENTVLYTQQDGYIAKSCGDDKHQYDEGKADIFSSVAPPPIIYTCKLCGHKEKVEQTKKINTQANFTFFPSPKSNLHEKELQIAYEEYMIEHNWDLSPWGTYEIYNYTSEEIYNKYNLDVFEVYYEKASYYFIKYNDILFQISPFDLSHSNSQCINHIAITDINNDGYIEILTATNSFADRGRDYYCTSFIRVIDTKSKNSIKITDYDNINYFKENEEGVISIYNADGIMPVVEDLHDGILDEKYYNLATNLFDTPVLNTSHYEFDEKYVKTSCDLFEVEITINDGSIKFPYLFKSTSNSPYFTINVKMTYLGETFSYTSPDGYLDGAVVSFVNNDSTINCEGWGAFAVITKFVITTGMEIEREYRYHEDLNVVNEVGLYDMVITYENEETNLKESIVIKDFLQVTR